MFSSGHCCRLTLDLKAHHFLFFFPAKTGAMPSSSDFTTALKLETRRKNSAFHNHQVVPVFSPAITGSQIEIIL